MIAFFQNFKRGSEGNFLPPLFISALLTWSITGCGSLAVNRPLQEMSDTVAALRAAKEVSADTLAPDLYRKANEAYFRARNEYRFKNFIIARDYAAKAKRYAEEAEFEALKQGATRTSTLPAEDTPPPVAEPYDYPSPRGTPGFLIEESAATGGVPPAAGSAPAPEPTPAPGTL